MSSVVSDPEPSKMVRLKAGSLLEAEREQVSKVPLITAELRYTGQG